MLTEERYNIILELLREKRSVTVAEIKDLEYQSQRFGVI